MVASVGLHRSPSVTGSILKGKEQGNERERPLLVRSMSASGRLHRWLLSPTPLATGGRGYLVASGRPPVVQVCGLDVVASIGRPWLLVLSSKGKSRATKERGRYWLGSRCHSLGYWWPWLSVRSPPVFGAALSVSMSFPYWLSIRGQCRPRCRSLGNWWPRLLGGQCRPPVVPVCGLDVVASIGRPRLLALSSKGNEQGNERERPLLARSMSFPWQLVAVVTWWPVSASIGLHRLLALSAKGNEQGNESRAQLVASVTGSVDVIPLLVLSVTSVGSRCHSLGNWWPRLLGGQCRPP